ncbi:MAG TPA: T9SS type A sorting domain-containing protein, partial [Candidatus Fermentibacter sp.]|nr:T9SS type A sorting domain-containing protein [Candidatus Fermentibacter sp.]
EHPQYDDDPNGCGALYYLGGIITTGIEGGQGLVGSWGNLVCSANPVSGSASFGFDLAGQSDVEMVLMDLAGRNIATLASGRMAAGHHDVAWNAGVPTGVYLVRVSTADFSETMRIVKF